MSAGDSSDITALRKKTADMKKRAVGMRDSFNDIVKRYKDKKSSETSDL
jgi:hypothetical protein